MELFLTTLVLILALGTTTATRDTASDKTERSDADPASSRQDLPGPDISICSPFAERIIERNLRPRVDHD